jgi:hypothetical protein
MPMFRTCALLATVCLITVEARAQAECDPWSDMQKAGFSPIAATIDPMRTPVVLAAGGVLLEGERVIVTSGLDQRMACVVRVGPAPDYQLDYGQIYTASVTPDADPGTEWNRPWQAGIEQFIDIQGGGDGLYIVSGDATWGMSDPQRVESGGINIGSFVATIKPKGGRASFSVDYDGNTLPYDPEADYCAVRMWLAGGFLAVLDNYRCGGMNVTFTGFYAGLAGPD